MSIRIFRNALFTAGLIVLVSSAVFGQTHTAQPIVLNKEALFDKIVTRRRGGFCYELNGMFGTLLSALGFEVQERMLESEAEHAAALRELFGIVV